ncbi:MAG: Rrf2 family transcriptional regulator [Eubacteriales bacterium]|nr:Rrf2 family transcriptional regulator [Eubacteriales bacterium]
MRISTRGVYALEAMLALGSHPADERVSVREISELTGLSDSYLEQIFALLKKSSLLTSTRGNRGGYFLARPAAQISIGDIVRAAEGSLSPVACTREDGVFCEVYKACLTRPVWQAMGQEIDQFFTGITLEDLCLDYQKSGQDNHPEFFI